MELRKRSRFPDHFYQALNFLATHFNLICDQRSAKFVACLNSWAWNYVGGDPLLTGMCFCLYDPDGPM